VAARATQRPLDEVPELPPPDVVLGRLDRLTAQQPSAPLARLERDDGRNATPPERGSAGAEAPAPPVNR
jgi:hypothetical protein